MKVRTLFLPLLLASTAALAQNSAPQPLSFENTVPQARDIAYPGTMAIDVDATDIDRAIYKVKQTIPVAGPGRMTLLFSKWLPGKHGPRGEVEKLAGLKITAGGKPIPWQRDNVDVYAFHIDVPQGARQIDLAFQFVSATAPNQGRVVITPEMMNLQFEQVSLYPAGYFTRRIPVSVTVKYPDGWKAASGLPSTATGSTYRYQTTDYETLIDSPVFAGRHFQQIDLGHNVRMNMVADAAKNLAPTPQQIEMHRKLVDQSVKLFGVTHFDKYEFLVALTDKLGGIGLEHHRSSENSVVPDYFTDWNSAVSDRNLLAHEFTHSWNGKFRRPAGMWTPDFSTPMRNDLLWVYEGQTQFWGYVLGARSGLFSKQETLDALAQIAAVLDNRKGRTWRPMQDTTYDPVITARAPKGWVSWQRSEDYYNEGLLIWLEADSIIRKQSKGAKSLDDFARAFFGQKPGDWGIDTYEFADVVATLNTVVPYDWATFLNQRRNDTTDRAPILGFAEGGYRLVYTDQPTGYTKAIEKAAKAVDLNYSLGMAIGTGGRVSAVIWDSPAFNAGLAVSNEIVAVNGTAYSDDGIRDAVTAAKADRKPIKLLIKSGDRFRDIDIDYQGGLRYPRLEKIGTGEGGLDRLLEPRR